MSVIAMPQAREALRVCLYGPTGSGKTTIARHLVHKYAGELIKVAEPLYRLQEMFYEVLQVPCTSQDGELLQFFADKIERERSGWLGHSAKARVLASTCDIVINDDCRGNSYAALEEAGFVFIRVRTSPDRIAQRSRPDHTPVDSHHRVEVGFETFRQDYELANDGTLDNTLTRADEIMELLLASRKGRS